MCAKQKKNQKLYGPYVLAAVLLAIVAYFVGVRHQSPDVSGELRVYFLDVGQGDCALIQTDAGAMLIDTGESENAEAVIQFIRGRGIKSLAYAVATHPHSDHMGGMPRIINAFPIDTFIAPSAMNTTVTFERMLDALEDNDVQITVPAVGDTFALGDAVVTILAPRGEGYDNLNNASIVLRVDYGQTSFLFTGDAEALSEREMLEGAVSLDADVLKVSHHGSNSSSTAAFLNAVSPEAAILSCGSDNSYGHPHKEVVTRLEKLGADIWRTDWDGTVLAVSDGEMIELSAWGE